uniref:Uncharacterized protein n=1 Tax=Romanomermis culicivorax TaxID=13658 RepID=A0A915HWT9_ROMCU
MEAIISDIEPKDDDNDDGSSGSGVVVVDPVLSAASTHRDLGTPTGLASRSPPMTLVNLRDLTVDGVEFRTSGDPAPTYHLLGNGRMSPLSSSLMVTTASSMVGCPSSLSLSQQTSSSAVQAHLAAAGTYATLTPLQPLPPISTVTPLEKYALLPSLINANTTFNLTNLSNNHGQNSLNNGSGPLDCLTFVTNGVAGAPLMR